MSRFGLSAVRELLSEDDNDDNHRRLLTRYRALVHHALLVADTATLARVLLSVEYMLTVLQTSAVASVDEAAERIAQTCDELTGMLIAANDNRDELDWLYAAPQVVAKLAAAMNITTTTTTTTMDDEQPEETAVVSSESTNQNGECQLADDLAVYFEAQKMTDMSLSVDAGAVFAAHASILAARSPYIM